MPDAEPQRYEGIQALRFVAALLVVLTHATFYVSNRLIPGFPVWPNGAAGVDVFFVISGFVMMVSSQTLIGRPNGWRSFMLRRVSRIVPLYWIATTLKLAIVAAVPAVAINADLDLAHVVKSYLFFPSLNAEGKLHPVLGVGWTLNFEMFFYVVFAAAMWLRVEPLKAVAVLFAVLSALALVREPDWPAIAFWADTIVLEFVAGMVLGRICLTGVQLPQFGAATLVVLGFIGLLWSWDEVPDMLRVLTWGVPATMIVAGVAFLEPTLQGRVPASVLLLGDSSYALYLFHPMVAPVVPAVMAKLGVLNAPVSITLSVLTAVVAGVLAYWFMERHVTRLAKAAMLPTKGRPAIV